MKYLSTRNNKLDEKFIDVVFNGLAKDGGLYLPKSWPVIDLKSLYNKSYEDVAFNIIDPFVNDEIPKEDLKKIIEKSYIDFTHEKKAPLVKLDNNKYILELFYGPTLAFKDYAMQFLGNLFSYMMLNNNKKITILGATSGDTGAAAINAFKSKKNINVFILHPHNKISEFQRRQMTTVDDKNIFNIAVEGTFDDCQKITKELFLSSELQKKISPTSINSINWARLIAQTVYFFWAYLQTDSSKVNFIVPSGNFGNIYSAHIAEHMGLPIEKLFIATNENDVLHKLISLGEIKIEKVKETYSPSMDIQLPSNFERQIFETYDYDSNQVKKIMDYLLKNKFYKFDENIRNAFKDIYSSSSLSNDLTLKTIKKFNDEFNYLPDPHTATGLAKMIESNFSHPVISLACAHPAKFGEVIKKSIGKKINLPESYKNIFEKNENLNIMPNNFKKVENFILSKI
tara:strand:+ start:2166 stop:3533 length:1368 start_codon:yes stop_codon:yes gene_type:complete